MSARRHRVQWGAQDLFERVFLPLYPSACQSDGPENVPNPANDSTLSELIDEIAEAFKFLAPSVLGIAHGSLDDTDSSIERLGAALTRERRDRLLGEQTIGSRRTPMIAMIAIHGTLYVGRCLVRNHGGLWLVRDPLWESTVSLHANRQIEIFHWWIHALSDPHVNWRPLSQHYQACISQSMTPC